MNGYISHNGTSPSHVTAEVPQFQYLLPVCLWGQMHSQFRCCCCCFPLAQFPDSESNTIRAFGNLGRQNIAHIIRSWLLLVGFPSIYLFPLTFYYQQQEETRLNPQHFAWRSQLNISVNHLQVLLST